MQTTKNRKTSLFRRFILYVSFLFLLLISSAPVFSQAIIADHTFVDYYDDIPQQYIDSVKKRWLSYAGESHSEAIRVGMDSLQNLYPKFAVNITEPGTPEGATNEHLRVSRATWGDLDYSSGWIYNYGEEDWWTSETARQRTRDGIKYCNENGYRLDYFAFGWCYDGSYPGVSGSYDPVYQTRWGGESVGSADGEKCWGLDSGDSILSGNRVNMSTYLNATKGYIDYCTANGYPTKILFTTGPVDEDYMSGLNQDEVGYQQYLKWKYIRDYVSTTNYALFDYADILCYNNAGVENTTTWVDHNGITKTFPLIHPDNNGGNYVAHIGSVGALRLAKAMWVLLAIEEGWTGGPQQTDTQKPTTPTNLQATAISTTQINLSWSASTDNIGVTGYRIYRGGSLIATVTTLSYSNTGLTPSTQYQYQVSAIDAAGNESVLTSTVTISTLTPTDTQKPTTPANLQATAASTTQINLSWDAASDNIGVTGYRIYRGGSLIAAVSTLSYSNTGLTPSTQYQYQVSAIDAAGNESTLSSTVTISTLTPTDTQKPTTPTNLEATAASTTQINLSWNAATDNIGVTGYRIYRDGSLIISVTTLSYSNTGLTPSTQYQYQVSAVDAAGNESVLTSIVTISTLTPTDTQKPTTPTNLEATAASTTQINLSWSASTDNIGVTGYRIYRGGSLIATVTTLSYSNTGLTPSTQYQYQVSAIDAAGNESALTSTVTISTLTPPDTQKPTTPTNLQATAVFTTQINLSWSASTDNIGVTGYRIYRGGNIISTVNNTSYSDKNLTHDTEYDYQISAIDAAGNESEPSETTSETTLSSEDNEAPSVPSGLQAQIISSSEIDLSWEASVDNKGIAGYRVYRNNFLINNCISTEFSDTGLINGNTFEYYITAFDSSGNESSHSLGIAVELNFNKVDNPKLASFSFYPNPSNGNLTIEIPESNAQVSISIYSITGTLVYQHIEAPDNSKVELKNIYLSNNIYILKVIQSNRIMISNLVFLK